MVDWTGIREQHRAAQVCGAMHLHTTYSDGRVPFPQFIATARSAGLDFIGITDHMTLRGRDEGFEGFHGSMFVMVGYEHNDADNKNHYLAFGVDTVSLKDKPQEYIDDVRAGGGIGFLAHPCEKRHYFKTLPPYPWTDWAVTGFDGLEIWNQMSDWTERLKTLFSLVKFMYPRRFLFGTSAEVLAKWDALNRTRFTAGIGGVDAHSHSIRLGPFRMTVFPLKVELRGVRTHLYLPEVLRPGDTACSRTLLMNSLRDGRGYISNVRWGNAAGSLFYIEYGGGETVVPGAACRHYPLPARMHVRLPLSARVLLLRNGQVIDSQYGKSCSFPINSRGIYRIEARRNHRVWIYTNPFPVGEYPF